MYPPRGDSAHARRIPGRHKNGKYAAVTRGRPAFQQHESRAEGSDTPHTWKYRKNAKREFLSPPSTGLPPKPSEAVSVGRGRATERERVLPLAAGRGIRRPLGRRPASHLSGLRRSRCPAKCTGRGMAPHPISGRKPTPTQSCGRFCGNAFTRLRRRSFKGGPVPL